MTTLLQRITKRTSKIVRSIVIADSHDAPNIPQERFKWIGKHTADFNPDYIIHIGDFATFDSVSTHEKWETCSGKKRNPLQPEFDSFRKALDLFLDPIEKVNCKAKREFIEGNHEDRVRRFENQHPALEGMLWPQIADAFSDCGFKTHAFKEWIRIDGVDYTHVPHNAMGKRYTENTLLNDAVRSIVYGDSHKPAFRSKPKAGDDESVKIFNPGCSLPHGHVEPYALHNTTGWGYGIGELYTSNGKIIGQSIIPMLELQRRYS